MLDVDVTRFGYRRGRSTLTDVSVRLDVGRTVLLGPNGAGKTTLLKAIAGIHPFQGSISLDGRTVPTSRRRPVEYRVAVGWLPQDVVPFPNLTAREHVAYLGWLKGMTTSAAWTGALTALESVGLGSRAKERAERLSGGQTRRLGIAGVLVHGARYLLLDEPTAGLDPRERDRLIEVLRSIEATRAVLVSTHDSDALIDADATVQVLQGGTTKFRGSRQTLVSRYGDLPADIRVRRAYADLVPEE